VQTERKCSCDEKETKAVEGFGKDKREKDGIHNMCKRCVNKKNRCKLKVRQCP
jgi:hypothetical protein